ncbi:transglutaminaseTgpA domain-containing protein [Marinococcus halophilus]|uniref:transglutaminaseTgpA domain-containing protein n=1 Tax=Marinococcus halophilus TaxID=1371 RepID=UPI0036210177
MVKPEHTWKKLIVYILGYFLLAEWLLPLPEATGTGSVTVFMLVSAAFFIVIYLRPPWWAVVGSVLLIIMAGVNSVFYEGSPLQLNWLVSMVAEVQTNVVYIISGQWYALTDMFRSVLFMLLLAIMSYLIYFWVVQSRRILLFLTFTIIYIGVMDTFFEYDGMFAIIRTFVIGFLLLGLLQWERIVLRATDRKAQRTIFVRWTLIMAAFLITAGGVGVLAPKSEPRWPDPVPFLTWGESSTGSSQGVQKIGYDGTDERLGGGFQMSDMPVFTASGDINGYWRGKQKTYIPALVGK